MVAIVLLNYLKINRIKLLLNLKQKVKERLFREDLYYRLNVIPIYIPPLRERKEDIPVLTKYFIDKYCKEFGKEPMNMSVYAMDLLMEYGFPGNVRELENMIERSVALETSNIILPESLEVSSHGKHSVDSHISIDRIAQGIQLDKVMEKIEKDYILSALKAARGSKQKAAELLGISLRSFRYRLDKAGLNSIDND